MHTRKIKIKKTKQKLQSTLSLLSNEICVCARARAFIVFIEDYACNIE